MFRHKRTSLDRLVTIVKNSSVADNDIVYRVIYEMNFNKIEESFQELGEKDAF
jgi:hypothetical protein